MIPALSNGWFAQTQQIPVHPDVSLSVLTAQPETSTRSAALFLGGTWVTPALFTLPTADDGPCTPMQLAAQQGHLALAPCYAGYGDSSRPIDGRQVTLARSIEHLAALLDWAHHTHGITQVHVVGASLGAALGMALAQQPGRAWQVAGLVFTSMVYKNVAEALRQQIFSPQLRALFQSAEGGYIQTTPMHYAPLLQQASPYVSKWAQSTFPGSYALGLTLAGFDLPLVHASGCGVPALIFWGTQDMLAPRHDVDALCADYGGPIQVQVLSHAGHAPLLEPCRASVWQQTFAFMQQVAST